MTWYETVPCRGSELIHVFLDVGHSGRASQETVQAYCFAEA
jgi:hypothetical protein